MTDYFALLEVPRSPWLDDETLKQKFLVLSGRWHPDRVHEGGESAHAAAQAQFSMINAAYQCLRDPKNRLRHLLMLERGAPPADLQPIEPELMSLFQRVDEVCGRADRILRARRGMTSRLLQVQWLEESQQYLPTLLDLEGEVRAHDQRLQEELRRIGITWTQEDATEISRAALLGRLEALYRGFGFLKRWKEQLQERRVGLQTPG